MGTYWCSQPARPTWSPLLNILRLCKSGSIPAVPVSTGDTSKCSASQSGERSCSATRDPRIPQERVLHLGNLHWQTEGWGNHQGPTASTETKGKDMRERCRALKTCFPEDLSQMAENDRDEQKLRYFCHWKGTKYLMLLYNCRCSGLCLK